MTVFTAFSTNTAVIVSGNSENLRVVPLLLPIRFDEMFHEESRFQTKRENRSRGDTNKCRGKVGKGEIGSMATYMCR